MRAAARGREDMKKLLKGFLWYNLVSDQGEGWRVESMNLPF
jgi:hypothetical protein